MMGPIVLLTDFGLEGPYVGQMKGVLAERAPGCPVIDLTHAVRSQDIREGAFLLESSWTFFPARAIFIAVVDPGVGTERGVVALDFAGRRFVGPDNGLLTGALPAGAVPKAVRLENPAYRLPRVTATFHGRDLFAPAGAALAAGVPLEHLGPPMDSLVPLRDRFPSVGPSSIEGRIVHIDRFGNLVSDVNRSTWERWGGDRPDEEPVIEIGGWTGRGVRRTYGDSRLGETMALFGGLDYLEVAVNGGNAAARLGLEQGARLSVRRP